MAVRISPKSDKNRTQAWVTTRLTSLYAQGSTRTTEAPRRTSQQAKGDDVKKVQDWAGDCMTDCYNH